MCGRMVPGDGDACWQERKAVSSLRLEMTDEIVTVEFVGQEYHRDQDQAGHA